LWDSHKKGYKAWLQLEKSLSDHSVSAYLSDLEKLTQYFQSAELKISPREVRLKHLQKFTAFLNDLGMSATSQARIISGIRSFFDYCVAENIVENDPTLLLEAPKTQRKLPDTLSVDEVEQIISAIDLSTPEGTRNKTNQPLRPFHNGAFRLALDTGKSLVPALIFNTRKVLPANKTFYAMPHKVEIHFLEPVAVKIGESVEELRDRIHKIMSAYYQAKS